MTFKPDACLTQYRLENKKIVNYFSGRQERQNNADQMGREQPLVLRVQSRRQARRTMSDTRLHQSLYIYDTGSICTFLVV